MGSDLGMRQGEAGILPASPQQRSLCVMLRCSAAKDERDNQMYMLIIRRPDKPTQAGCFPDQETCLRTLLQIHDVVEVGTTAEITDPKGKIIHQFRKEFPLTLQQHLQF